MMGDFDFLLSFFFNPSEFSATDESVALKIHRVKLIFQVEYGVVYNFKE